MKNLSSKKNNPSSKSQASVEYLMIIGFVAVITIPLIAIYHAQLQESSKKVESRQILQIARAIADSAETVYYLGEPSQTEIKVFIPENIASAELNGKEIIFRFKGSEGVSDILQVSKVNLTGTLPISQGQYTIILRAEPDKVRVSYS